MARRMTIATVSPYERPFVFDDVDDRNRFLNINHNQIAAGMSDYPWSKAWHRITVMPQEARDSIYHASDIAADDLMIVVDSEDDSSAVRVCERHGGLR